MPRLAGKVILDKTKLNFIQGFLVFEPAAMGPYLPTWPSTASTGTAMGLYLPTWPSTGSTGTAMGLYLPTWLSTGSTGTATAPWLGDCPADSWDR